jgi:transposase
MGDAHAVGRVRALGRMQEETISIESTVHKTISKWKKQNKTNEKVGHELG